jgi:hypothetical protein
MELLDIPLLIKLDMPLILDMPPEIIIMISNFLGFRDNRNLSLTCNYLYQLLDK